MSYVRMSRIKEGSTGIVESRRLWKSGVRSMRMENEWAKEIKTGKKVKVEVNIKYDKDALRLSIFEVKYSIDGK